MSNDECFSFSLPSQPQGKRISAQQAERLLLPQLPEQCTGAGAGSAPAENAAAQPSHVDGMTRSDLAAKSADFERLAKLMVEAHEQAEAAEKEAAVARGELVLSPDRRLLPAGDPTLELGNSPPQPPEPVVLMRFGDVDDIVLDISDDGLYTTITKTDAPDIYVYVFETEHMLRPNEWADPDDPFNEAVDGWEAELVISRDGKTWSTRPKKEQSP